MDNKIQWICPKCNWTEYNTVNIFDKITLHICDRCSVVFGDPYKFNLITFLSYDAESTIREILKEGYEDIKKISEIDDGKKDY